MRQRWNWGVKLALAIACLYAVGCVAGGVFLSEMQLHPPRRPIQQREQVEAFVRREFHATVQDLSIQSSDGLTLRAWYIQPGNFNRNLVLLLHGVGDNREGVAGYARLFLQHGYAVLLPDARAHGESAGSIATYGLLESEDIRLWLDSLPSSQSGCVYGFGESMGAVLLLQSLSKTSHFCAVVVESPFANFEQVAYERAARHIGMPYWFGRTIERPVVDFALFYTRWKYGLDLRQANPADAVAHTRVPILLIADEQDQEILPHHVIELKHLDPSTTELWTVRGAAHGGAWAANPDLFNSRVAGFFDQHK